MLNISTSIDLLLRSGLQQHQAGRLAEAENIYRQILSQRPNHAEAWFGLGNVLQDRKELVEAIGCFKRAVALKPDHAAAYTNLGNALQAKGQFEEAVIACRRAVAIKPDLPEAYNNLGNALASTGQKEEAIACYERAVALRPDFAAAHFNLGAALQGQKRFAEAIAAYRRAVVVSPGFHEAYFNLGAALQAQGRMGEAVAAYRQVLALKPDVAQAYFCMGNALRAQDQIDAAIACFEQAIRLKPDHADAYANLANGLKDAGRLEEAIARYRQAIEMEPKNAAFHSNLLLLLNFYPGSDRPGLFEEARRWSRRHAEPLAGFIRPHENDRSPERRLRIGYVSRDYREHPVGRNLMALFREHDHEHFEIICYAEVPGGDSPLTKRFRGWADGWRDITGLSDEQVTETIREDRIDILVDLALHTDQNRLRVFARKPAPVQVTFAGYPGTTGLSTIDYRLTDPYLDPPGPPNDDRYYSEASIRLPETFWCYEPLTLEPSVNELPAMTNGYVTFGCLNNFFKINEAVITLWARVLQAVRGSRLMLLAAEGSHRQHTSEAFGRAGIGQDRVEFFVPRDRPEYLKLYHRIDLGLDTFPYSGHTTSLDSFWMGVPVLTLPGRTVVGRAGVCQLMNLGLPEWIADTADAYVGRAPELAGDLPRLSALRAALRGRMQGSPLMDGSRYSRHIEAAYRQMWKKWCAAGE